MAAKTKVEKFPLVMIEWLDHCSHESCDWRVFEQSVDMEPLLVLSAGWLMKETPDYIVIVPHFQQEFGMCTGEMCIMKSSIKKKTFLNRPG